MSRAMNLSLNVKQVTDMCSKNAIGISTIEPLQAGGTRVVTMTSEGAVGLHRLVKSHLIDERATRSPEFQARRPIPYA